MTDIKRPFSNPLALAILVLLYERPMHPYEMATTMRERRKESSIKLNYGSLYTVIEQLLREKFIAVREVLKEGKRPEKTVYELRAAGEAELIDWMRERRGALPQSRCSLRAATNVRKTHSRQAAAFVTVKRP